MTPAALRSSQRNDRLFAAIIAVFTTLCACSNAAPSGDTPAPAATAVTRADIVDVIYESGTTDEGVLTLLGAPTLSEPTAAAVVIAPADQSALSGPVTFSYRLGASAARERGRSRERRFAWPEWLTLERSAYAHGAPMNGDAFLLVFSSATEPKLLRVFTQERTYEPTAGEWQRLTQASGSVSLAVTHAIFEQGRLTQDGGPFAGTPVHFTVVAP